MLAGMSSGARRDHFWAVVPAGGSGTRLWPLSRRDTPKFLQDLTGSGRSLLQDTLDRLRPLCGDRVLVVTGARHAAAVREQLPELPEENLLVEPEPRDSMPAIGWAAAVLERRDPEAVIGSFAADHVIGDAAAFRDRVEQAVHAAADGSLVTLGITPGYPATGYGYISPGAPAPVPGAPEALRVARFVEKPDLVHAREHVAAGDLWNAGMFVVGATRLLDLLARWHPELASVLRRVAAEPPTLEREWAALEPLAIDHAVAEPAAAAGEVAVVPGDFPWDDVGDFASLADRLVESGEYPGVRVLGPADLVVSHDSTGVVAARGGRTVVTLGIPDVVVIDTVDAVLVTTRERVQDVKQVVETLRRLGKEELT